MGLLSLDDILVTEFRALRSFDEDAEPEPFPQFELLPSFNDAGTRLRVEVAATVRTQEAELAVRVEVRYELSEPIEPVSEEIMGDLLGGSTVVTAAPYVREALHNGAVHIRVDAPFLPLITPTRLQRDEPNEDEPTPD